MNQRLLVEYMHVLGYAENSGMILVVIQVLLRIQALDLSEARTDWYLIRKVSDSMDSLNETIQSVTSGKA